MNNTLENKTLALAALLQSVYAVDQIAKEGKTTINIQPLITSLLNTHPKTATSVYQEYTKKEGEIERLPEPISQILNFGLTKVISSFSSSKEGPFLYAVHLLVLQRKLRNEPAFLKIIASGIELVKERLFHYDLLDDHIFGIFADLYTQTVSKLGQRINVKGDPSCLAREENVNKIRTLLLAGIRAAILWQQCGGSKWDLIFSGKKIANCAKMLQQNRI